MSELDKTGQKMQQVATALTNCIGTDSRFVYPDGITEEMMAFAKTDDTFHFAANLNAMLEHGYCKECGLVPSGCEREGCGGKESDFIKIYPHTDLPDNADVEIKVIESRRYVRWKGGSKIFSEPHWVWTLVENALNSKS